MAKGADELASMLDATAGELARSTPRQPSTAVPEAQVRLARSLMDLHRDLPDFVARIVPGGIDVGEWKAMALTLEALSILCRTQAKRGYVIDQTEQDDDG